jgi:hypothetical protein
LLKNLIEQPLPHGRGSVTAWKHEVSILSRARQQAVPRLFQQARSQERALARAAFLLLMVGAMRTFQNAHHSGTP